MFSKNEKALRNIHVWKQIKKGRNKEYLTQLSTQTAVNVEMIFSSYDTLWFSLVNFWRVKHGKRLRIWKKNYCRAEQQEISELRS